MKSTGKIFAILVAVLVCAFIGTVIAGNLTPMYAEQSATISGTLTMQSGSLAGMTQSDTNNPVATTDVTPHWAGQILTSTLSNSIWVAKGTTTNDWVLLN